MILCHCSLLSNNDWKESTRFGLFLEFHQRLRAVIAQSNLLPELDANRVVKEYLTTGPDGKKYGVLHYNLDAILAVVWANQTDAGIRHNVSVVRLYRDGETWATSDAFGRDDLPLLSKVADLAHPWIFIETQNGLGRPEDEARDKPAGKDKAASRISCLVRPVDTKGWDNTCAAQPFSFPRETPTAPCHGGFKIVMV